ncbi:hypothetical protein E4U14_001984 [Claviceps sp. LM454 group G7]|nr:hypothetical protein E4U14_001984 [Claviceps sp. LM454 group G7]
MSSILTFGLLLIGLVGALDTGNHPEWPRWCGKVYQPQYPSFPPGGQTVEPALLPDGPALDVQFKPRYSIYLAGGQLAEFIVKANPSPWRGQKWPNLNKASLSPPPPLFFNISLFSNKRVLVSDRLDISSSSSTSSTPGHGVFAFNLSQYDLTPRFEPYQVVLTGADPSGTYHISATSELVFLPDKKTGSITRLDHLNGGILFRSAATNHMFEPFLPFGYYASCDRFLCDKDYVAKVKAYQALGMNSMVSLTTVQDSGPVYKLMDGLDMRYMYDLREWYKNLTAVREQVSVIRDFEGLYSYWGADEPDGHQDPFNLLPEARDAIRQLDPYHPVSVTLNCQDFYFDEYTAGAEIIMEDAYPIGINSSFSKWGTPCNATYGDCGCDNCQGNVQDVSSRLDTLARYETWLGLWPKTKAHNPQTFHGEGYWSRDPTDEEVVAMNALAFHHGAKLIAGWVWPFTDSLGKTMGSFGAKVSKSPVREFVVTGELIQLDITGIDNDDASSMVEAACWVGEQNNKVLVSVVNGGHETIDAEVSISLPRGLVVKGLEAVVWGNGTWTWTAGVLKLGKQSAMATNMVIMHV